MNNNDLKKRPKVKLRVSEGKNSNCSDCKSYRRVKDDCVYNGFEVNFCDGVLGYTNLRMLLYISLTVALSMMADIMASDQLNVLRLFLYTAHPKNVFNEYFVKLAFGWTLGLVLPPAILASFTLGSWPGVAWTLLRALISTSVWFGCTNLFNVFRNNVFANFDTSGHCFLLIWCIYYIIEESQVIKKVDWVRYPSLRLLLDVFHTFQSLLVMLWDVMLFSTLMFYHTLVEKLVAVTLALSMWLVIYRGIYVRLHPWFQLPRQTMNEVVKDNKKNQKKTYLN